MSCSDDETANEVEIVVKLHASCDLGVTSIAREAICSSFAADLGLPVPEPFIVKIDPEFANALPNSYDNQDVKKSIGLNFGTKILPRGFSVFSSGTIIPAELKNVAFDILLFDEFVDNSDRRVDNPNLLWDGKEFAMIDHEMTFPFDQILNWTPIWQNPHYSLSRPSAGREHVLRDSLRSFIPDVTKVFSAFRDVPRERLAEYVDVLPNEWQTDGIRRIPHYLAELQANIERSIGKVMEALG